MVGAAGDLYTIGEGVYEGKMLTGELYHVYSEGGTEAFLHGGNIAAEIGRDYRETNPIQFAEQSYHAQNEWNAAMINFMLQDMPIRERATILGIQLPSIGWYELKRAYGF